MNDFTILTKAVATAEEILKEYSASSERVIKSKSDTVLGQISEYLYNVLNECDFTEVDIQCMTQPGYFRPETPSGYCGIKVGGNPWFANGTTYNGILYVRSGDNWMKVYFNHDGILIKNEENNNLILVLCYHWKKLKADLDIAIKKSLESRLNAVKREADIVKSRTALIDDFEL